jgi:hypothetical protein
MARPRKPTGLDPLSDLDRKAAILEREMLVQRAAMDRLKEIATTRAHPSGLRHPDKIGSGKPATAPH